MSDALEGMTQAKWDRLSPAQRAEMRDNRNLHPALIGQEGKKIRCQRNGNTRTFRVGISTGWRPIHLAMRGNARGSSDVIGSDETITGIKMI